MASISVAMGNGVGNMSKSLDNLLLKYSPESTEENKTLNEILKPKEKWTCPVCDTINKVTDLKCFDCQTEYRKVAATGGVIDFENLGEEKSSSPKPTPPKIVPAAAKKKEELPAPETPSIWTEFLENSAPEEQEDTRVVDTSIRKVISILFQAGKDLDNLFEHRNRIRGQLIIDDDFVQVYREEFLKNPRVLDPFMTLTQRQSLLSIHPTIYDENDLEKLKPGFDFIWSLFDDETKYAIINGGKRDQNDQTVINSEIFTACQYLMSVFPRQAKVEFLNTFVTEYHQSKGSIKELEKKKVEQEKSNQELIDAVAVVKKFESEDSSQFTMLDELMNAQKKAQSQTEAEIVRLKNVMQYYGSVLAKIKPTDDEDPSYSCPICFNHRRTHALSCGHVYCDSCIQQFPFAGAGRNQRKCPECRGYVDASRPLRVYL